MGSEMCIRDRAKTIREALAQHRQNAACNSCHKRIDPLGFALEAFDATGRLRPGPVDTAAQLQDGTRFDGHTGLRRMLLTREQPAFTRQLATRLLAYALGRALEFPDEAAVQGLLQALRENDLRAEVKRLLADERARRFVERFTLQWLRIDGLGTRIKPDAERFPQATPVLLRAMKEELSLIHI